MSNIIYPKTKIYTDGNIIGSGTVSNPIDLSDNIIVDTVTASNIVITETASINILNTIEATSLKVGDKYITIMSGANTQAELDRAGILFGSASAGETGEQESVAHIVYRDSDDKIEIYPGLKVSGSAQVLGNITGSGNLIIGDNIAPGINAVAVGYATTASGDYSHAEGVETIAYNQGHAEGYATIAGNTSHAEGYGTKALGTNSHTEGQGTLANGNSSHSEGYFTTSSANYSHAEGIYVVASNIASHAEGNKTLTLQGAGVDSSLISDWSDESSDYNDIIINSLGANHSEGLLTTASGYFSHAEGISTKTYNAGDHAEGLFTTASGSMSHAEGLYTTTTGSFSHVEGAYSKTIGIFSHAEGRSTTAVGGGSHSEGLETLSSGSFSHAEGYKTNSEKEYSHAEGYETTSSGDYSHAEGRSSIAQGWGSHAEGYSTIASGNYSHAEGGNTLAIGHRSHTEGTFTTASANYQHVQGQYNATSSTALMLIGNGTGPETENRSNILEVYSSSVVISGGLHIQNGISASNITSSGIYVNYIDFNTSIYTSPPPPPAQLGRIFYNSSSGDLSTYLNTNGLYLNNGQQLIQKVENFDSVNILKGQVVHITGSLSSGAIPKVKLADWTNDGLSANTLGLAMENINIGNQGYIIVAGTLEQINTNGFSPGEVLYLSSSGNLTNIKPLAPKHNVSVGQVVRKQLNNGSIYVKIQNGYELDELHDVSASIGKTNGDLLSWDSSNSVWKNTKSLTGSYNLTGNLSFVDTYGINFGATSGSTASSVTLNDYEEGVWTPSYSGSITGGSYNYTEQSGRYTKIGNLVNASGFIRITTINTYPTGNLLISGLPYSVKNESGSIFSGVASTYGNMSGGSDIVYIIQGLQNNTYLSVRRAFNSPVTASDLSNNAFIGFSISYRAN